MNAKPNDGILNGGLASSYFCGDCDSTKFSIVNQDGTALSTSNANLIKLTDRNIHVDQSMYIGMTTYRFKLMYNN